MHRPCDDRNFSVHQLLLHYTLLFGALLSLLLPAASHAGDAPSLSFGVVPQQSASKLARDWGPMLAQIEATTGIRLRFKTAPDIPTFEQRLSRGEYDFSYMNPYHYTVFSQKPGYRAIANARDKRITGIIVVRKDAPYQHIEELAGATLAFPSPAAFAASILTRTAFSERAIPMKAEYVSSHDSVYRGVAKGLYVAGGGIKRTLNAVDPAVRQQLRILWTTPGYTPHAIAVHPRVFPTDAERVKAALVALGQIPPGKALLAPLKIEGWQPAQDADWDDVRALDIHLLDHLLKD
jgi:phosphonate transport system substrate-binding protein